MRLLLAEDERSLARAIVAILEKNNYAVDAVYDGAEAVAYLRAGQYDGAILDVMMPEMDGITAIRHLRAEGVTTPILILSARGEVDDKVEGLDAGANDYLTKPFATRELLARIRAMTRAVEQTDARITLGNITLDCAAFTLSSPHGSYRLANREFQLMELLMRAPRRLISTEQILERIWGFESEAEISIVWVYISYLRKKLTALEATVAIRATRNAGYSLEVLS